MSELLPNGSNPLSNLIKQDLLAELLAAKRSQKTRHAYSKDLSDFFQTIADSEPTPEMVGYFLRLEQIEAVALVSQYKAKLIERCLSEATVNRRLSAIKALVRFARQLGKCHFTLEEVKSEKVKKYRDTTGISRAHYHKLLNEIDCSTLKGVRDYALLRLLWDNALRRGEIESANIGDFDSSAKTLRILGKGRGTEMEIISLANSTVNALCAWLGERNEWDYKAPLFIALDPAHRGHRLTGSAIYWIVDRYCKKAGIKKQMSPHRIRHSSITAALDATDGNVRKVQKLSRHSQIETLLVYDDNRSQDQLEISEILSQMV
jgi:integrase/recombinase XerC